MDADSQTRLMRRDLTERAREKGFAGFDSVTASVLREGFEAITLTAMNDARQQGMKYAEDTLVSIYKSITDIIFECKFSATDRSDSEKVAIYQDAMKRIVSVLIIDTAMIKLERIVVDRCNRS